MSEADLSKRIEELEREIEFLKQRPVVIQQPVVVQPYQPPPNTTWPPYRSTCAAAA